MHLLKESIFKTASLISILVVTLSTVGCNGSSTLPSSSSFSTTSINTSSSTLDESIELNICAGVGLTDAIQDINDLYMDKNKNVTIIANFAASGTLQKQVEQGAPADVFFTPGGKQMQALQDGGYFIDQTRQDLLHNKVVLIVPADSSLPIAGFTDLLNEEVEKVAIGDPEFVPVGAYGIQALDIYSITEQLKSKLVLCNDVRQVLNYVETGNVEAGIVFATDAAISNKVKVVAEAPEEINNSVVFTVAIIKTSKQVEAAKAYISFLKENEAGAVFEKYGFTVVNN